ncbi:MAG: hypothetical protein EBU31_06790, partial [Proteobacteria bacterium]|nr:hypothetical protein [Pseudomonadota bacterium]
SERVTNTNELVLFITPIVVDNPDENDSNYNVSEIERLRALEKPLDSKVQELQRDAGLERKAVDPVAPSNPETQPFEPIETPAPQQPEAPQPATTRNPVPAPQPTVNGASGAAGSNAPKSQG